MFFSRIKFVVISNFAIISAITETRRRVSPLPVPAGRRSFEFTDSFTALFVITEFVDEFYKSVAALFKVGKAIETRTRGT